MFLHLLERFYCRKTDGYRVTISGTGGVGKTTILYKLALGQLITTYPTIGFNIETVNAPTTSGRKLTMTCWDIGPGCGIQSLVPTVRMYSAYSDAIIWVVDSSEKNSECFDESVEILGRLLRAMSSDPVPAKGKVMPVLM